MEEDIEFLRSHGWVNILHIDVGIWVELREIDEIAFVRYASVYRRFQDIEEFEKEIESLRDTPSAADSRSQISIFQDEEES